MWQFGLVLGARMWQFGLDLGARMRQFGLVFRRVPA